MIAANTRQLSKPSPSSLVVHGPHATGKSNIVRSYLEASKLDFAIVRCRGCVTGRHLLERTIAAVLQRIQAETATHDNEDHGGRCENLSALTVHLQRLLRSKEKFILVFDGVDRQREAPPTLLPALARLGEYVWC